MLWQEMTRDQVRRLLPQALVVVPVGAVEQHGPHLPTWTDALIAETVSHRAVSSAAPDCPRPLILTPTIMIGASDHHLPFSGTLSLSVQTLTALLLDLARSVAACGGRRMALVNGHGGNRGACGAAAAAAATQYDLAVACTDYWNLWSPATGDPPTPGHAGGFETALIRAIRPDLVGEPDDRPEVPEVPYVAGFEIHSNRLWRDIDGYTDQPARFTHVDGDACLAAIVAALAARLTELARVL